MREFSNKADKAIIVGFSMEKMFLNNTNTILQSSHIPSDQNLTYFFMKRDIENKMREFTNKVDKSIIVGFLMEKCFLTTLISF